MIKDLHTVEVFFDCGGSDKKIYDKNCLKDLYDFWEMITHSFYLL